MRYFVFYIVVVCFAVFLLPIGILVFFVKIDLAPAVVFGMIGGAIFLHLIDCLGWGWRKIFDKRKKRTSDEKFDTDVDPANGA